MSGETAYTNMVAAGKSRRWRGGEVMRLTRARRSLSHRAIFRLQPLLELVQTTVDGDGNETTDTGLLERELQRRIEADAAAGLGDPLDLNKYAGMGLLRSGWALMKSFDSLVRTLPETAEVTALLGEFRVQIDGVPAEINLAADNILVRGDGKQSLFGGNASDRLYAGAGDDNLNGGGGHNVLVGVEMLTYPHCVRRSKEGRRWEHGDTIKPISNSAWRLSA